MLLASRWHVFVVAAVRHPILGWNDALVLVTHLKESGQ